MSDRGIVRTPPTPALAFNTCASFELETLLACHRSSPWTCGRRCVSLLSCRRPRRGANRPPRSTYGGRVPPFIGCSSKLPQVALELQRQSTGTCLLLDTRLTLYSWCYSGLPSLVNERNVGVSAAADLSGLRRMPGSVGELSFSGPRCPNAGQIRKANLASTA